jgi:carbonic anhydrase
MPRLSTDHPFAARGAAAWLLAAVCGAAVAGGSPAPATEPAAVAASVPAGHAPVVLLPDLRQRIEERLARMRAARTGAPAARPAEPAAAVAAAASAAAPRPRVAAPAARPMPPARWSYEGEGGPQAWARLDPANTSCARGERQSPIDIRGGIAVDLEAIAFDYRPGAFRVIDNGHTVQVNVAAGNHLTVGGRRYELQQFHFHRPSEERIAGRQFAMSLHLVHRSADGRVAIVAVLLDEGPAQPAVQLVWNHLPLEKHEEQAAPVPLDPAALLPEDRRYYTYMGSLTEPPCTEGVLWLVMKQPGTLSARQEAIFARLYPMNARPVQAAAGRLIKESE